MVSEYSSELPSASLSDEDEDDSESEACLGSVMERYEGSPVRGLRLDIRRKPSTSSYLYFPLGVGSNLYLGGACRRWRELESVSPCICIGLHESAGHEEG